MQPHFLVHDSADTVGVVVVEGVAAGNQLSGWVMDTDETISLTASDDIPLGHKVALAAIAEGDTIIKYGHDVGRTIAAVPAGGFRISTSWIRCEPPASSEGPARCSVGISVPDTRRIPRIDTYRGSLIPVWTLTTAGSSTSTTRIPSVSSRRTAASKRAVTLGSFAPLSMF